MNESKWKEEAEKIVGKHYAFDLEMLDAATALLPDGTEPSGYTHAQNQAIKLNKKMVALIDAISLALQSAASVKPGRVILPENLWERREETFKTGWTLRKDHKTNKWEVGLNEQWFDTPQQAFDAAAARITTRAAAESAKQEKAR